MTGRRAVFSPRCAKKSIIQYRDRRTGNRLPPSSDIEVVVCGPEQHQFRARVEDVRNHGFSIVYTGATLPSGTEFLFQSGPFRGRARLMWSRRSGEHNEGGCVVLAQ